MRQFPQDGLLSHVLARNALTGKHIDALAATVASFHGTVAVARSDAAFPTADNILLPAMQNFAQLWPLLDAGEREMVEGLRAWTQHEYAARRLSFARRRREGFVRECHGDLHLGNIALIDDAITVFDGIEFNQSMRWIDVMSDVAFLVMDLQEKKRPDLASRFLNGYLEITGDYEGLDVLRFYLAYRAMVRAKVTRFRVGQVASADRGDLQAGCRGYLDLAHQYARGPRPAIVITHGPSGCGKTTLSQALLEVIGAIRIRTDVERKRAHGLSAQRESRSALGGGLYAPEATRQLYLRVSSLARGVAHAGHIALVDGTFLKRWQRDLFRTLAAGLGIPFVIIAFSAGVETLRERITRRIEREHDASEATFAVLEQQLLSEDAIGPEEGPFTVEYNAEAPLERARETPSWRTVIDKLGLVELARPRVPESRDPGPHYRSP
jgi:predicted kinase